MRVLILSILLLVSLHLETYRAIPDMNVYAKIAQQLFPDSVVRKHWSLTGGVSASMSAMEIETCEGEIRSLVIRQHRSADWKLKGDKVTINEYELLLELYSEGVKVPKPLMLDCSVSILDSPYLVTEYIDGTTSVPPNELADHLLQMAHFLSFLHSLDPEALTLPKLPQQEDPINGILKYLPKISDDENLLNVIGSQRTNTNVQKLLHGDYWPGNVMWNNGRLVAVIDWEDSMLGNPAADFACSRVELFCAYGREAMDIFSKYYLAAYNLDEADLCLWEIYASSSALVTMPSWGLAPAEEEQRAKMTNIFLQESAARFLASQ